jgi:hypothetical protein
MKRLSIKWIIVSLNLLCIATCMTSTMLQAQVTNTPAVPTDIAITAVANTSAGSSMIDLKMPKGVQVNTLKATLNGTDISERFRTVDCEPALCEEATLSVADGVRAGKNVLTVIAKSESGAFVSSRLRFEGSSPTAPLSLLPRLKSVNSQVSPRSAVSGGIESPFMPPTISLKTVAIGGWGGTFDANNPWFRIGTTGYPSTTPTNCSGGSKYLAVVLDRQTLVEKTASPESSSQCLANAGALTAYLKTLSSSDLVVIGTNYGQNADAGLDTTPIGGTKYAGSPGTSYPAGYMAIGVGGASPGTAYEPYYFIAPGYEAVYPFAMGTLQEDSYGNYNFQSSDVVEYAVSPNDPSYLTSGQTSVVSIATPASLGNSASTNIYTPGPSQNNGYWLLVVSRYSLNTEPGCTQTSTSADGLTAFHAGCGVFYATGSSDAPTSKAAYVALTNALNLVNAWQLAFLTTVGQAGYGNIWQVGGFQSYTSTSNGFMEFSQAVQALYGTPNLTLSMGGAGSAYTLISSPGNGGPLNGASVESTTTLAAQGQSGLVHGILQRNLNGLFLPAQTSQESQALFAAKGGTSSPDFKLTKATLQQPTDWPSSSQTNLLSGADSLFGQLSAYRYLSWVLLNNIYMKGIQGSHQDDIHYFFTGSSNTFINYHTYDSTQILWPDPAFAFGPYVLPCDSMSGPNNTVCTSNILGANDPLVFTENDFVSVRNQLSLEVRYLTNTLQFLVTGSASMKATIAGGNSSVGIALTGAAATILGSKLVPVPPITKVTTSWQNIVSMIGGIASVASAIPGIGTVAGVIADGSKIASAVSSGASAIGGIAGIAAGAGQITSSSTSNALPSSFGKFATTIGQLADGSMQGQLSSGFDTTVDSITSDWGRISTIGPMVVDSDNTVFFSPNQVIQNIAVSTLTSAASRSFYIALMPIFNNIQYWQGVSGDSSTPSNNIPDMGYYSSDYITGGATCSAYYLNPKFAKGDPPSGLGSIQPNSSVYYPSSAGTPEYFDKDDSGSIIDFYVIAGSTTGSGSDSPNIQVIDPTLANTLFSAAGLNLPIDEFVTPNGPMRSVWTNAHDTNPAGHTAPTVCNAGSASGYGAIGTPPLSGAPAPTATSTTLLAPTSSILGSNVVLSATVMAGTTLVTQGKMFFLDSGVIISTVPMTSTGTASTTLQDLSLGAHSFQAKYSRVDPYDTSSSAIMPLTVYTNAPDLNLSISNSTLQVSYGATSSPLTLQVTSLAGLAGTVNLTCSGLPVGMTCSFNPAQVALTAGSVTTASFTISGTAQKAGMLSFESIGGLLLLPLSLLCLTQIRKGARNIPALLFVLLISAVSIGGLAGCSGGATDSFKETGSKTILVIASTSSVTKSIPVLVNIQ